MKEESEYLKLLDMLEIYSKILHPNFLGVVQKQLMAAYEENKRQAYQAAKISDKAILLDQKLNQLEEDMKRESGASSFYIRCLYKEFLKMYLK